MACSALALLAVFLCGSFWAQVRPAPSGAEFPEFDGSLLEPLRTASRSAAAARALAEDPAAVPTFILLVDDHQPDAAIGVLEAIVARHPDRIAAALTALGDRSHSIEDEASGRSERLRALLKNIKTKLPSLPRDQAASIDYALIGPDLRLDRGGRQQFPVRMRRIVMTYPGTPAARLAEVDAIERHMPTSAGVAALEAFAREHRGTVEGAKALFEAAFDWGHNLPKDKKGEEPSGRFARVVSMARDLQSGAWPASEWVTRAPSLIVDFFAYEPRHSPEGIRAMLDLYRDFIASQFALEDHERVSVAYLIDSKIPKMLRADGDASLARMEPLFDAWARIPGRRDAVRFARAQMFQAQSQDRSAPDRVMWRPKTIEALTELAASEGAYARKALATLASLYFQERDFASAAKTYAKYLALYPRSDWAWAAQLRLGQSHEELGDWSAAASAYRRAAVAGNPLARVLGFANAARSAHALEKYDEAMRLYRAARDAWDPAYVLSRDTPTYALTSHMRSPGQALRSAATISHASLDATIARLQLATTSDGGDLLERGRWLVEHDRWLEAQEAFERFLTRYPQSPHALDARYQVNLARLQRAMDVADVEKSASGLKAARRELESVEGAPWDPAAGVARMAEAALLFRDGKEPEARLAMRKALDQWRAHQSVPSGQSALGDALHEDVAEIRRIVFRPLGGPPYVFENAERRSGWNAFTWPSRLPDFIVVDPHVSVTLADGSTRRLEVFRADAGTGTPLFIDDAAQALMARVLKNIGGTRVRQPSHVMETPNQPIGMSREILAFWATFFPARPGHWGGWEFETYPVVTQIVFYDKDRTKAGAKVTIGYSGATVVLEKIDGSWKATRLTGLWIT